MLPSQAAAASDTISFSARLKNTAGGNVPDGYYNVDFKLYSSQTGGTPVWSETYYDSNGITPGQDNRVRVVGGYLSVKLGSQNAFGPDFDWTQNLWLTLNIGGTAQISTVEAISWDGEMAPRIQLTAVPYAMNANSVGGRSADQLVQLGQGMQTNVTNNASIAINNTGSGDLLHMQSSGVDMFRLQNNGSITMGATSNQSISVGTNTSGAGHNLQIAAGGGDSGGTLVLRGGSATDASGVGGDVVIDTGSSDGGDSAIALGTINATSITIGNSGSTTTVAGELSTDTIDAASVGELIIGGSNATAINLGQNTHIDGSVTARNQTDSTTAFQIQNATGDELLTVNTADNRITLGSINTDATLLVLDSKTTEEDPAGVNGAMYYNSALSKFRCYQDGAWQDCITPLPVSQVAETDTDSETIDPKDVTDMSFDLAANTKYYYKFVIIHEADEDTTGIGFGVTAPDDPVMSNWCINTTATLDAATPGHWGSYCGVGDAEATTTGEEDQGTSFTSTMEGYIETDEAGVLQLRMKSSDDEKITVKAGTFGILQIVQ